MSNIGIPPHEPGRGGSLLCPCAGCGLRRAAVTTKLGADFPAIGSTVVRGLLEGA